VKNIDISNMPDTEDFLPLQTWTAKMLKQFAAVLEEWNFPLELRETLLVAYLDKLLVTPMPEMAPDVIAALDRMGTMASVVTERERGDRL